MHPDKSLGPDGLNLAFFSIILEYYWEGCVQILSEFHDHKRATNGS